ncbi:putative 5-methyltetrahydropteroyltriglutamate--homocysteine S-methyltransferase [Helianthus annuus]|nr:putative 5-methyltetrahydropteroyltriglutamate--homocysteine S-methyltransferase [Helianthus annuus]
MPNYTTSDGYVRVNITNFTISGFVLAMMYRPILPTTTIGPFPQTIELRRVRPEYKAKCEIFEEEYVKAIKRISTRLSSSRNKRDIDVFVHGKPKNGIVEYFGDQLYSFASTANRWCNHMGPVVSSHQSPMVMSADPMP